MARLKGSKNKHPAEVPEYTALPTAERLVVLANIIVDRIAEDQSNNGTQLKKLLEQDYVGSAS